MASFAKDLLVHKCYRTAEGGNLEALEKLLREEKSKNPKRIPYFFSASRKLPGKFCLGYQPGSKPRVEYVTVTPYGFRYRNHVHDNVDSLICWFKEHYQDPVPRPLASQAMAGHGSSASNPSPSPSSRIPHHISRNLDYSQLQAAVDTANQRSLTGNTPYTPTHLAYSGPPTPQFGQQGRFGGGTWRSGGGVWDRTPVYPTAQTPQPVGSVYGTATAVGTPSRGKDGHGQMGVAVNKRHNHMEPPGTPVLDE